MDEDRNRGGQVGVYDRPQRRPPAMAIVAGVAAAALAGLAVIIWLV